ncbi:MAG: hypothetical protein M8357_05100 [Desulfobulbaceae bacterium]|nr:hypothetical protein [Desulfobulbaceae bacterium]
MPNTFVHLGIQSVSTKTLLRTADFKWIAVGCIIPDVPWIIQRILLMIQAGVDPLYLRQYAIVQASLFGSLILCGALASLTAARGRIFVLLALNVFLHLLLDAGQIKWAGGVHFLAPFSWQLTGFNLIWPEHAITHIFSAAGFAALVYYGAGDWKKTVVLATERSKYAAAAILLVLYFILPFWLRSGPDLADNHFVATLRNVDERPGKYLELDRSRYRSSDHTVGIFSGERLRITGTLPEGDAIISVRGRFSDRKTIHLSAYHVHSPLRDTSSVIALAGVLLVWLAALMRKKVTVGKKG